MTASARISSATRRSSVYGSPCATTNVSGTPSRAAPSSACCRRSVAVSSSACSCAAIAPAPAPAAAPYMADGRATYTQTSRAPCRRASPAAYAPARIDVTESSTPTRMTLGPSVPSSKAPG
jgi:hypothetical protein